LALVFSVMPIMPGNLWGGLLGRALGTHLSNDPKGNFMQDGEWRFLDFSDARAQQAYDNLQWRKAVQSFVMSHDTEDSPTQHRMGNARRARRHDTRRAQCQPLHGSNGVPPIEERDDKFQLVDDHCVPNTYADYERGTCWICQESGVECYDKYPCGHIFCSACSSEMLSRHMPCPLCRRAVTSVVRSTGVGEDGSEVSP
jgi:hypothetical protein